MSFAFKHSKVKDLGKINFYRVKEKSNYKRPLQIRNFVDIKKEIIHFFPIFGVN